MIECFPGLKKRLAFNTITKEYGPTKFRTNNKNNNPVSSDTISEKQNNSVSRTYLDRDKEMTIKRDLIFHVCAMKARCSTKRE